MFNSTSKQAKLAMNMKTAFLEKRKPNFMQFRMKNKEAVDQYLDDFNNNRNQTKPE